MKYEDKKERRSNCGGTELVRFWCRCDDARGLKKQVRRHLVRHRESEDRACVGV
jgi:hypothetical protein